MRPCVAPLWLAGPRPLTITHWLPTLTQSRETIQLRKTAAELLTLRSVWECRSNDMLAGWNPLCSLSFFLTLFLSVFSSLPLSSPGSGPSATAATSCVAEDDWIYPVAGVHCRPGATVGSFSD